MNSRILGRRAGDGPRHARAPQTRPADRRIAGAAASDRNWRRLAALVALFVIPTAATVTDLADHPLAAHETASLENEREPSSEPSAPVDRRLVLPAAWNRPAGEEMAATTHITAAPGETIWSIAERIGAAPGVVLRHNRGTTAEPVDVDGPGTDALASGQPLERAERLVVPALGPRTETDPTDGPEPDVPHPVIDSPELLELEPAFDRWADHFGVPRDLLKALAWVESGWDNDTRSTAGGIGIGRIQPLRARYLADHVAEMDLDPSVDVDNIALTAAQLRVLLDETFDVPSAVAAHRQGITDTRLSGIDPLLDGYVEAVLAVRLRFA